MKHQLIQLLKSPFPYSRGGRYEVVNSFKVSMLAFLLLYLTRPFGLDSCTTIELFGFWLVSIVTSLINLFLFHRILNKLVNQKKWTVGLEIFRTLYYLVCIALAVMIYANWALKMAITTTLVFKFIFYTLVVGVIPISIRVIRIKNWLLKKHLKEATKLNRFVANDEYQDKEELISIQSNQVKESLETTNFKLIYLKSDENYVDFFVLKKGQLVKRTIRISFKRALALINDPFITQCHRSYAVNLRKVEQFRNGGSELLILNDQKEIRVPVSRTFKKEISERMSLI